MCVQGIRTLTHRDRKRIHLTPFRSHAILFRPTHNAHDTTNNRNASSYLSIFCPSMSMQSLDLFARRWQCYMYVATEREQCATCTIIHPQIKDDVRRTPSMGCLFCLLSCCPVGRSWDAVLRRVGCCRGRCCRDLPKVCVDVRILCNPSPSFISSNALLRVNQTVHVLFVCEDATVFFRLFAIAFVLSPVPGHI